MPWVNAQVAYLLIVWWATATIEDSKVVAGKPNPSKYDEVVATKDTMTTDAFLSHVIHARMRTAHTGEGINVMTQALHVEDGSLLKGLTVQNIYMELQSGSKNVAVVVRNSMVYPQTLRKKTPVVRAVAVTWLPDPPVQTGLIEASEETHGYQMPKLAVKQRQEKLFEELDLSGLKYPCWQLLPGLSGPSTMLSSHWNPVNLAAPIQLNMWLKLLMILHSKNYLDGYLCHW